MAGEFPQTNGNLDIKILNYSLSQHLKELIIIFFQNEVEGEVMGEKCFHHSENGYFFHENLILLLLSRKEGRKQCGIIQTGLKN